MIKRTLLISCLFLIATSVSVFSSNFKNKVVLVTGGSEGIGFSTSLLLARKGAIVVFCARDSNPSWFNGSSAEKKINSDGLVKIAGGSATFFKADTRNIKNVREFIQFAHNKYGRIDYAVNNAGIGGYLANITQLEDEYMFSDHDAILNNLYGTLNCIREEANYWYKYGNVNNTYSIVVLSSLDGKIACAGCSMYGASKFGIIGLVKSAALEFINVKPKIRINAVCPGFVDTSLTRNQLKLEYFNQQLWEGEYIDENHPLWPKFKAEIESQLPGKRLAQPEELAKAIISILDNDNSYMNGAVVSVDDGVTVN